MIISNELKNFIKNVENTDLINSEEWEELIIKAGVLSLELIQILKSANIESIQLFLNSTQSNKVFESLFSSFLKETENLKTGYFGNNNTKYSGKGFHLYDQTSDVNVEFDLKTRNWSYFDEWDVGGGESGTYSLEGQGFDNLLKALDDYNQDISGYFRSSNWSSKNLFIGDDAVYPFQEPVFEETYDSEEYDDDDDD